MYIEILPCDLKRARSFSIFACPVARAIRRQMCRGVNDDYVHVNGLGVWFGEHFVALPEEVVSWVEAFDDGEAVEPIEFDLDVPADISMEYVQGRMLALSSSAGDRSGDMRSLREVINDARVQVSDLDDWERAA